MTFLIVSLELESEDDLKSASETHSGILYSVFLNSLKLHSYKSSFKFL